METSARVFRFGRNELDAERYALRRMGRRVRLSRSLTELLFLLVERQGKLVTREEIANHLWTNPEMVDVVQGINTAINRLRGVLNDDPSKPRFIETVVGKGYRFIANVEEKGTGSPIPEPHTAAPDQVVAAETAADRKILLPPPLADWDVSPDGRSIAIAIHDRTKPRIRLGVLGPRTQHRREREISLTPPPTFLSGVSRAVDGKGFYAGTSSDVGCEPFICRSGWKRDGPPAQRDWHLGCAQPRRD